MIPNRLSTQVGTLGVSENKVCRQAESLSVIHKRVVGNNDRLREVLTRLQGTEGHIQETLYGPRPAMEGAQLSVTEQPGLSGDLDVQNRLIESIVQVIDAIGIHLG